MIIVNDASKTLSETDVAPKAISGWVLLGMGLEISGRANKSTFGATNNQMLYISFSGS